jgi:Tfp pilus assembly protein PilO
MTGNERRVRRQVAKYNDYNFSHLELLGLDVLVIFLLYLHNFVVVLAYIGTDNQFIPENDEFKSDDEKMSSRLRGKASKLLS